MLVSDSMVTRTKTESEVVMRATAARNIQVTGPQNNAMTYEGLADKSANYLANCKVSILGHELRFPQTETWFWSDGKLSLSSSFFNSETAVSLLETAYRPIAAGSFSPP